MLSLTWKVGLCKAAVQLRVGVKLQSLATVPQVFADQFRKYLTALRHNGAYQVPQKWRAQMNLVLAIGAKYSHLISARMAACLGCD